jgi:hypothetical protein
VSDPREVEERRFGAIQALRAVTECLRESNPQAIFGPVGGKDAAAGIDQTKIQSINNRWADKASDVLVRGLDLADKIAIDALDLFEGEPSRSTSSSRTPSAVA